MTTKVTTDLITSVDASKLTGTLPASMATVLTSVNLGIATLGLHMGVADNKAAFNLPNSFIDTFEDDTGITTETDVNRDTTGEYVSSVSTSIGTPVYVTGDRTSYITPSTTLIHTGDPSNFVDGSFTTDSAGSVIFTVSEAVAGKEIKFDFTTSKNVTEAKFHQSGTPGGIGTWKWQGSSDDTTYTDIGSSFVLGGSVTQTQTELSGNTLGYRYYRLFAISGTTSNNMWNNEVEFKEGAVTVTTNATGTLISDAQTASATTECSGVMLYTDASGTNTLGTDLKIYFTANNGTNWTEAASYGTAQTFSGTTKQVKLGKTTVTSGTQVAMKAVWANQASGSKVAQLNGWAVNY